MTLDVLMPKSPDDAAADDDAHASPEERRKKNFGVVDYAKARGAIALIRGLRAVSDFEYELQMALMNRKLAPSIETIYLAPSQDHIFLSSSLLKEIVMFGGENLSDFVPPKVERMLLEKFGKTGT